MVIKASDSVLCIETPERIENSAGAVIKRFGIRRMRALELIR
jgi:hypothetical protein